MENDSNVKVDRASMASSVEVRSPLLDYRIIEFSRSLPLSYRYSNGNRKKILKDILAEYIPRKLFDQPKKGFSIPVKDWIRNELKDDIILTFTEKSLSRIPYLNIKKIIQYLDSHMNEKEDFSYEIWRVYILIKWLEKRKLIDLY